MKTTHTSGPWCAVGVATSGPAAIREIQSESGLRLALVGIHNTAKTPDVAECVANANLFAAAPDLLAALKGLLAAGGFDQASLDEMELEPEQRAAVEAARAAIAKAGGAS